MKPKYPFLDLERINGAHREALAAAALRVIDSGRYIGGVEVERFEAEFAGMCGVGHAIGVSNGLDALRLIFRALVGLGRLSLGDEVLVPANTFIATFLAVADAGLVPVPVDPDPSTMNLSGRGVAAALTDRTRGIVPVHLYGRTAWDAEMRAVATERGLLVVEDAAQAVGGRSAEKGLRGGCRTGGLGHAAAFSFYPAKNLGALGDAGAVTTDDDDLACAIRRMANYGFERKNFSAVAGFNCRLDPMQAALLGAKLPKVHLESEARRVRARLYDREIDSPYLEKPSMPGVPEECVWHQYVIRTPYRTRLMDHLEREGVETAIHYPVPPHKQPCFAALRHGALPVAERLADEVLSLPISSATSEREVAEIADIINRFDPK